MCRKISIVITLVIIIINMFVCVRPAQSLESKQNVF